ncbi:MAG: exosortase/archaeosortase family protein [Candidatus Omnitrophica bacterium]|nr:exosortase/archaeosortase family protein [Candidatus Omnitrophota bacterium]
MNRRIPVFLVWFPFVALLTYTYYPTFVWMVDRWLARDSYYSHGFLIPLVSGYWLWKKRRTLASVEMRNEGWGILILSIGALMQMVSSVLRIYFLSAISLVIILLGAVSYLFGRKMLKETWFPIAFLLLMVPLPLLIISEVTLKLKFFVSEVSAGLLNAIGIHAVREGSYIHMPHAMVLVGDPCSGLRSFLAFLCLGLVFAYGGGLSLWKRATLLGIALPLAILSNIGRVFAIGLLAELYGMEFISGWVHDASGIAAFAIALAIFVAARKKLESLSLPNLSWARSAS